MSIKKFLSPTRIINFIKIGGTKMKAALCILDGCNTKAFEEVIEEIAKKESEDRFYSALKNAFYAHAITSFPTVTTPEHATLITACYPVKHGIAGMEWYGRDIDEYVDYFFFDNIEMNKIIYDTTKLRDKIKKFFKGLKSFTEGLADFLVDLNISHLSNKVDTIFEVLADSITVSFKEFIARGVRSYSMDSVKASLAKLKMKSFSSYLKEKYHGRSPLFLAYWKAGTDTASHKYGPYSKQLKEQIKKGLDRAKDIVDFYLSEEEEILIVITADHAQSSVSKFPDFAKILSQNGLKINKYEDKNSDTDAILVNNGRMFYLYLIPKEEGGRYSSNVLIKKLLKILQAQESVDLIFYIEHNKIKVADKHIVCDLGKYEWNAKIYPSNDERFPGKIMYPNYKARIEGIMRSERSGDMIVSLKEGFSTHEHKGDHGSLRAKDSVAPLLIHKFMPIEKTKEKPKKFTVHKSMPNSVDIIPTILMLLGYKHLKTDGKIIEEVISRYG